MKGTLNLSVVVFIVHTEFRGSCSNSLSIKEMIIIIIIIIIKIIIMIMMTMTTTMMMMMMMMMITTFSLMEGNFEQLKNAKKCIV